MIKIAILGYGVVGAGVAEVLCVNKAHIEKKAGQSIEVKHILDLRVFPGDPFEKLLTKDFAKIENDPEVSIVVESIGGETVAYDFAKRALLSGKSVCTPNKALIAKHGPELFKIAREKNVSILFEACVGGGIPLIRPFTDAMLTDEIQAVSGILNGTGNYILTQMSANGTSYSEALKSAQALGYAEQDPTADVGGYDACRKLSILLSLATGKRVNYENIKTEGIDKISEADFAFGHALGFTLKQIVSGKIHENGVEAATAPFFVPLSHPIASVNDVYNAAWVTGKTTGNVMFYGSGAGKLPTASAVVTNIIDAVLGVRGHGWDADEINILPEAAYSKVVRVSCGNPEMLISCVKSTAGADTKMVTLPAFPGQVAWVSPPKTEAQAAAAREKLKQIPGFNAIERVLRVYDTE